MAGDSAPVCATSGEPSTRLPLGGLGQLVPSPEFKNSENQENDPKWAQKLKITGAWAPRQVLTRQQGLDAML